MIRGIRLYGALDLGFAALYAFLGFGVAASRSTGFQLALGAVIALLAASGVALVVGARGARALGIVAAGALLAFALAVLVGLVASSAYLWGVYGPFGRGLALAALVVAALVVELFALLPLFQLRFLLARR